MTRFNRTLVTGLLLVAVATPSVGCAAGRAASFLSKLGSAGKAVKLGQAAKAAQAGRVVSTVRGTRVVGAIPQTPLRGLQHFDDVGTFLPDEVADLYVVSPKDEASFVNIHRRFWTDVELQAAVSGEKTVATAEGAARVPRTEGGIERFAAYLDGSPSKNIIVVGHNQGGNFYFANGESLPLSKMATMINERGKRGIFLSCRAKRYLPEGHPASTKNLKDNEALRMADDLMARLRAERPRIDNPVDDLAASGEDAQLLAEQHAPAELAEVGDRRTYRMLQEAIDSAESRATVHRRVKRSFTAGTGGGFTYYVVEFAAKGKARKRGGAKPRPTRLNPSALSMPARMR